MICEDGAQAFNTGVASGIGVLVTGKGPLASIF